MNQFGQYEAGELPSESNTLLLQFFCDPRMLRRLFEERMAVLPAKTVRKLSIACESGTRPQHKSISSMALVGSNWSGPGLYMAAPEHEAEAGEKAASFYVPTTHVRVGHQLFDGKFFA